MLNQRLSNRECLNNALAHLRPLGTLTRKYEPDIWRISALLPKYKGPLIKVDLISNYISPVEKTTSSLRESIRQVRQFENHVRVNQVLANGLTIRSEGVLVIC